MDDFEVLEIGDRLAVAGELDMDTAERLADAVAALGQSKVTVDISRVTFIDSSGLRALLVARQKNPALRVVGATSQALRVFDMAGVTEHVLGS